MVRTWGVSLLILAAMLGSRTAEAVTITTLNRSQFQAAVSGGTMGGQNFDSLANGTLLGTLGGVTYGASAGTPLVTDAFLTTTSPNGLGSTSAGFFQSTETASFGFGNPITAFAIDVNTFAPTNGAYSATLNIGGTANSLALVFSNNSTGQFIGFVSDTAFTGVTIKANTGFTYTLDTLVFGSASAVMSVPEPATLALLGSGLFGLGLVRRRQR